MAICVFCEIGANGLDKELTVFECEHVLAQVALDQKPGNRGHVLVMPRRHVENLYELTSELHAPLMYALHLLSRATKEAFAADGIHVRQNNGPAAGQDVFHLHFHVIPRYHADHFETEKYERLSLHIRRALAAQLREVVRRARAARAPGGRTSRESSKAP